MGIVAASRLRLWHTDTNEAMQLELRYNWLLHDFFKEALTLSHQNSFMHATLSLPLSTLIPAGLDWPVGSKAGLLTADCTRPGKYFEPSHLLCPLEDFIPIPAPSYTCARAQKAFLWKYVQTLADRCDFTTSCDEPQHIADWDDTCRLTSRVKLQQQATHSMETAVQYVQQHLQALPIMGNLWRVGSLQSPGACDRISTTNCYDKDGNMVTDIPDCTCRHCQYINNTSRFAAVYLQDGPIEPFNCTYSEPY